jgi:hypothetical protein
MTLNDNVVSSHNIFIDSRNGEYTDQCDIDLRMTPIIAKKDEYIKITLNYFDMANNLYNINFRNCIFDVSFSTSNTIYNNSLKLTNGNYYNLHEIASDFAVKLGLFLEEKTQLKFRVKEMRNTILRLWTVFNVNGGLDTTPGRPVGDGNQLLDISLEAFDLSGNTIAHGVQNLNITFKTDNELHLILGGLKTSDGSGCMLVNLYTGYIRVRGYFPMNRSDGYHTYLRCDLEGYNFSTPINNGISENVFSRSNILGLFKNDIEFITYNNVNDMFDIRLVQKSLSKFKIWLSDYKGRKLINSENEGTSSGLQDTSGNFISNKQNTKGNLYFTAGLNIKVIKG